MRGEGCAAVDCRELCTTEVVDEERVEAGSLASPRPSWMEERKPEIDLELERSC